MDDTSKLPFALALILSIAFPLARAVDEPECVQLLTLSAGLSGTSEKLGA